MTTEDESIEGRKGVVRVRASPDIHPFLHAHLQGVPPRKRADAILTLAAIGLAVSKMAEASEEAILALHAGRARHRTTKSHAAADESKVNTDQSKSPPAAAPVPPEARAANDTSADSHASPALVPAQTVPSSPATSPPRTGLHVVETDTIPGNITLGEDVRDEMSALFG